MKLTFCGAAGEVTGSCYLLETARARVLIDFGLHQGDHEERNRTLPPLNAPKLDAVILSHAHLDHSGLMPLLPRLGYKGRVVATPATIDLVSILLHDSAKLQEGDAERARRHAVDQEIPQAAPLYGTQDVDQLLPLFTPLPYDEKREVAPGITARLVDAGHIIGSASIELTVEEPGRRQVIVFSADLGPTGAPLVRDPTTLQHADVLLLESTYGDRDHRPRAETVSQLQQIAAAALNGSGKVLIPSFAVGRTQDLIYEFGKLQRAGQFKNPTFVDSPMAIQATELYARHVELLDCEAHALLQSGIKPLSFPGLEFTHSAEESKRLNGIDGGAVIIAGSGMCNGGRIVHHLIHNLPNRATQVVFVGYQAVGTTGRRIVDGQKTVRILNQTVPVRAEIHTLGGLSAHAGQSGLVEWAASFQPRPKLFLTHGEDGPRHALGERLRKERQYSPNYPQYGETVEI
jgi:metallo-beta-lactamase family protein